MVLTIRETKFSNLDTSILSPLKLNIVMDSNNDFADDIEFIIQYIGDVQTDDYDQVICHEIVGPIPKGKVGFSLETQPINLELIPQKQLFGITSILIIAKYNEQQFARIGYFVNISYPGIDMKELEYEIEGQEINSDDESDLSEENEDEEAVDEFVENKEEIINDGLKNIKEEIIDDGLESIIEETNDDGSESIKEDKSSADVENIVDETKENGVNNKTIYDELSDLESSNYEEYDEEHDSYEIEDMLDDENNKKILEDEEDSSCMDESDDHVPEFFVDENIKEEDKFTWIDNKILDKTKIRMEIKEPPLITIFSINWNTNNEEEIYEEDGNEENENDNLEL